MNEKSDKIGSFSGNSESGSEQYEIMELFKKNYAHHYTRHMSREVSESDYVSASYYYSSELAFLPDELKQYRTLDLGAGRGLLLRYLKEIGFVNAMGIDVDPNLAAEAAAYLRPFGIPVINRDAFDFLPVQKEQFGLITAFDIIEHFSLAECFMLVKAIYEALLPGGVAVFRAPNMANIFGGFSLYMDITHQMGFTEHNLTDLLRHGGFSVSELYIAEWPKGHHKTVKFEESRKFHEHLFSLQDRTHTRCFDKNIVVYGVKLNAKS